MSASILNPQNLIAIDSLQSAIEKYLDITTVVEPSNAMAAIEVRVMVIGANKLNPLPKPSCFDLYVPYEWNLPVVVSVRATGANSYNSLAGQAAWLNVQLANLLENELYEIKGVGQELDTPKGLKVSGVMNKLKVVGDAELTNATFSNSGFSGNKEGDNFENYDGPFTYREDWNLTMVLTLHREFYSPTLKEVRFYNELLDEEVVVPPEESK
ncbi:hypothetical protein [Vibrio campbellii]|uniref:hypothetical protein n=1 Tax=Vibrio campbellii TaxID=680 RepID=UPI001F2C5357|nr:hypothetical protein [Vibrio campbellii]MCE7729632.1 hypothetical protein [Vibrio campbellii]